MQSGFDLPGSPAAAIIAHTKTRPHRSGWPNAWNLELLHQLARAATSLACLFDPEPFQRNPRSAGRTLYCLLSVQMIGCAIDIEPALQNLQTWRSCDSFKELA
jgi:hypothetical protein